MKRLLTIFVMALALVAMAAGASFAADYPSRNIKIIVPFAPGGAVDFTSRLISEVAPQYFDGKKIIVENMPGGGAVIGQTFVSQAKPDGYTILAYTSSVVNNPITKKTIYTYKSFQPVVMYCFDPEVLVVPTDSPYKTLEDFLAAAKEKEISIATPGFSTSHHVAALVLEKKSGAKFSFIHNESAAMQLQQLMGGHVEAGFMSSGEASGYVDGGTIRVLGIMQEEPHPDFPGVSTFREAGVDMLWGTFRGLAVPKDTPKEIVDYQAAGFKKVIEDPKFVEGMKKAGYPVVYRGPEAFEKYVDGVAEVMQEILPTLKK
ncbi:tripartite tricarboxylate transporter substrate binding protein [Oceanidesulfovibrio marinus]|uniref:Tripartite tricarboxylate transporter substrate binding protein n=1 Tax=Oceanidesulfovibrio marinus TaxID=370038 RepID=A0A6P1ZQS4_9BACT|nr:tripartite tricarboxylate transporter substrate binding protein [Oceanidesulfovibrio marinus]QJT08745.1 tripartite tricarboxylate transporter substrate binding protein [Oceanidesulfovibrio marinus]TVM36827.1 tripartite tricarboxylate transporter substrate binding protein [Oceanidesulfovibrio marinus]